MCLNCQKWTSRHSFSRTTMSSNKPSIVAVLTSWINCETSRNREHNKRSNIISVGFFQRKLVMKDGAKKWQKSDFYSSCNMMIISPFPHKLTLKWFLRQTLLLCCANKSPSLRRCWKIFFRSLASHTWTEKAVMWRTLFAQMIIIKLICSQVYDDEISEN